MIFLLLPNMLILLRGAMPFETIFFASSRNGCSNDSCLIPCCLKVPFLLLNKTEALSTY